MSNSILLSWSLTDSFISKKRRIVKVVNRWSKRRLSFSTLSRIDVFSNKQYIKIIALPESMMTHGTTRSYQVLTSTSMQPLTDDWWVIFYSIEKTYTMVCNKFMWTLEISPTSTPMQDASNNFMSFRSLKLKPDRFVYPKEKKSRKICQRLM